MNKAELKSKWGKYTDTDALFDECVRLFRRYEYIDATEIGVCSMLDNYFTNKEGLINLFAKHPKYAGDMRIIVDVEMKREIDLGEIHNFVENFLQTAKSAIVKTTDENGKAAVDYMQLGFTTIKASDLMNDSSVQERVKTLYNGLHNFNNRGETNLSVRTYSDFCDALYNLKYYPHSTISTERAAEFKRELKINEGLKTSRAFNRICTYYGADKAPRYNKDFAIYADMVSDLKRKLKFFISVNPLDYLTMSFGVNWQSCHKLGEGSYRAGCMSYMLDSTSIITYVHDKIPEGCEEGKIYRNMFHYKDGLLLQARIYPQGNDGNTDLYKVFRGFVQAEFSTMLGIENSWVKRSESPLEGDNVLSTGVHYKDYRYNSQCNFSYPKEMLDAKNVTIPIGANGVCLLCGRVHERRSFKCYCR